MTEAEWLECTDPISMVEFLRSGTNERKLRLFAVAFCRQVAHLVESEQFLRTIEAVENIADGVGSKAALKRGRQVVCALRHGLSVSQPESNSRWVAYWLAEVTASENAFDKVVHEARRPAGLGLLQAKDRPDESRLLRCIFGNPYRIATININSETIINIARGIYEDRAFERLPSLADALDQSGCHDPEILDHCREPGHHARGCWVLDSILGKS